jgi:branched-chain amino acid transport system substrate-binding protein
MKTHFKLAIVLFVAAMASIAGAQERKSAPGITNNQVLIGSCSALDGPARFLGMQTIVGATAYLNQINADGGVFGRKIQLLAFDVCNEPATAVNCF